MLVVPCTKFGILCLNWQWFFTAALGEFLDLVGESRNQENITRHDEKIGRRIADPLFLKESLDLQKQMVDDFWDDKNGGFYSTSTSNRDLPVRPKELYDGAIPSANSMALYNFLCLSRLTGDAQWEERAQALARSFSGSVRIQPSAFTFFLVGLDFAPADGRAQHAARFR